MAWNNISLHDPWWLMLLGFIPLVMWLRNKWMSQHGVTAINMPAQTIDMARIDLQIY
jgi:hypothetical protein